MWLAPDLQTSRYLSPLSQRLQLQLLHLPRFHHPVSSFQLLPSDFVSFVLPAVGKKKQGGENAEGAEAATAGAAKEGSGNVMSANQVPTTYNEMFRFNSAVMGFGTSQWMGEVLDCFNNIVTNVANSARLQEECDILVLRISRVAKGNVNFGEYKSCMLASLRSLLPKDWSTQHEVSWSWLWENVERIMVKNMGPRAACSNLWAVETEAMQACRTCTRQS
jgi:hypothetical protein